MQIELIRNVLGENFTGGELWIDGAFFCYTLEDKDRGLSQTDKLKDIEKEKVYGETAIPTGIYKVIINYSERFKTRMSLLLNVLGFSGIRIHAGTKTENTLGCILLGMEIDKENGVLSNSRLAIDRFNKILFKINKTEKVTINIKYAEL